MFFLFFPCIYYSSPTTPPFLAVYCTQINFSFLSLELLLTKSSPRSESRSILLVERPLQSIVGCTRSCIRASFSFLFLPKLEIINDLLKGRGRGEGRETHTEIARFIANLMRASFCFLSIYTLCTLCYCCFALDYTLSFSFLLFYRYQIIAVVNSVALLLFFCWSQC